MIGDCEFIGGPLDGALLKIPPAMCEYKYFTKNNRLVLEDEPITPECELSTKKYIRVDKTRFLFEDYLLGLQKDTDDV